MKNQGISLITLIITIIVIIILAAIVIFTGLRTPDSAQFSAFTNDVDTMYTAMIDKFAELKVQHASAGNYRTNEQLYIQVATGTDPEQYAIMNTDGIIVGQTSMATGGTGCQNIIVAAAAQKNAAGTISRVVTEQKAEGTSLGYVAPILNKSTMLENNIPTVRQFNDGWYVTKDGRIFNATGYTYNGKTYFNASYFAGKELVTDHKEVRATGIAKKMLSGGANDFEVTKMPTSTTNSNETNID